MVDLVRGRASAENALKPLVAKRVPLYVTPHIFFELFRGVRRAPDPEGELRRISRVGERFRSLPFDREAAFLAARMADYLEEQGERIPETDLYIAASAILWGDGLIVTRDVARFRRFAPFGLRVVRN